MNRSIIIMAKVPRAGNVKTRLQPFLRADQCEKLAEVFLFDAVEKTRGICDSLIIAFAPASEHDYFLQNNFQNITLIEQRGADLGEKMLNAFEFAFEKDSAASVVVIGTDSPTFPAQFIERAFQFLEAGAETILGKTSDGGFYLIGSKRKFSPQIFENVEWSLPRVYEQTAGNIERLKINLQLVPEWYDVDTPADLRRLRDEFFLDENARKLAAHTFRCLTDFNFSISETENKSSAEFRD